MQMVFKIMCASRILNKVQLEEAINDWKATSGVTLGMMRSGYEIEESTLVNDFEYLCELCEVTSRTQPISMVLQPFNDIGACA
jgi:hypothetical protein